MQTETVSFDLELVTPMFMGGADNKAAPEFRAASLKGLLRFWFRALHPHDWEEESRLFGTTDYQSPLRLAARVSRAIVGQRQSDKYKDLGYLGYGLINYDKNLKRVVTVRPYFEVGSTFQVQLRLGASLAEEARHKILRSFWALAMLGGLGARSRRGFGAFRVVSCQGESRLLELLPGWTWPDQAAYRAALQQFGKTIPRPEGVPAYTHFAKASAVILGPAAPDGIQVLRSLNNFFQKERSYYVDYRTRQSKTQGYPKADHDLMLNFLLGRKTPQVAPARAAFGLPHNYYFQGSGEKGGVDLMEKDGKGRRASPLIFHVQGLAGGKACGVVTYLPARLIPEGKKLQLSGDRVEAVEVAPPDYKAVVEFLQALLKAGGRRIL